MWTLDWIFRRFQSAGQSHANGPNSGGREFCFPRVDGLGVAKILSIAGGDGAAVPDGHVINQSVPEGLRLAFDLGRVLQPSQLRAESASHSLTAAEFRSRKRSSRGLLSTLRAALGVRPFGVPRLRGSGSESRVYAVPGVWSSAFTRSGDGA